MRYLTHCLSFVFLFCFACEVAPVQITTPDDTAAALEAEANKLEAEFQAELTERKKEVTSFPKRQAVSVPGGSVDALAAAIAQAGRGGTVVLESGVHTESATVLIPHQLKLIGQAGAVLEVTTGLHNFATTSLDPAIHVLNAPRTYITGIEIRPTGVAGGVGILVEDSPRTYLRENRIDQFQFGVLLEASDRVFIIGNEVIGTPLWQTNEAPFATGILTMKGDRAGVSGNDVSGFFIGIWACSRFGRVIGNEMQTNFLGLVLCRATPGTWKLPSGELSGSDFSAFRTLVFGNSAHDNLDVNIQAIDGANNNLLVFNSTDNAGRVDYEFTMETDRYSLGFLLPETFRNRALLPAGDTYVDCGTDNTIWGGEEVPADEVNCF
ncbi:right-handed parallel beta-helix repeat-containing protein [Neolewinella persica]|uniref:right-handed parallel beta-helix repeat-containing protein n=1 Tax=Neolewinella persica TaxID=70998 RepID=UPI00037072AF|nr:right-handed parallel beta-helix repeat-containing protein [Neolewinella persica]